MDLGTCALHQDLERTVAKFVGKEDAIVFSMGYGTNTSSIAMLAGPGSLIISDSLNHTSIVNGARASPAQIRVFRNNDIQHLEEVLCEAILNGQPKHHRPWKKIWVMVEGIYSMEGCICKLDGIVKVCKKYKAYVYVDEAHSIGALGPSGRGVCEQTGVNPDDVGAHFLFIFTYFNFNSHRCIDGNIYQGKIDFIPQSYLHLWCNYILFLKSFSGMGGYIASSKSVINFLRAQASGLLYHTSMSPIVCSQILTAFKVISGQDGTDIGLKKIERLKYNSNFFRDEMKKLGLHVMGDYDSPIIPVMIYFPCKIGAFSRECLKRGLAVVVVGFPATSVVKYRAIYCISAGHTIDDLKFAVKVLSEVADLLCLRYEKNFIGL
jgi:serine palmitoyltransferase